MTKTAQTYIIIQIQN